MRNLIWLSLRGLIGGFYFSVASAQSTPEHYRLCMNQASTDAPVACRTEEIPPRSFPVKVRQSVDWAAATPPMLHYTTDVYCEPNPGNYWIVRTCDLVVGLGEGPHPPHAPVDRPFQMCGSKITVDDLTVSESVPLAGAPGISLVYSTKYDRARTSDRILFGPTTAYQAAGFSRLILTYLGRETAVNGQLFTWDGKDSGGAKVQGSVRVNMVGENSLFDRISLHDVVLGARDASFVGLGNWTLSIHHYFSSETRQLFLGDGSLQTITGFLQSNGNRRVNDANSEDQYEFDSLGFHVYTRNSLTGAVKYTFLYDSNRRLAGVQDAFGKVLSIQRDGSGKPISIRAPYGQVTQLQSNSFGKLSHIMNPLLQSYQMTYGDSGKGLLSSFTDPKGYRTNFIYDVNGDLLSDSKVGGPSTSLSNEQGDPRIVTATSASGRKLQVLLNRIGNGSAPIRQELYSDGSVAAISTASDHRIISGTNQPSYSESFDTHQRRAGLTAPTHIEYLGDTKVRFEDFTYVNQGAPTSPTVYESLKTVNATNAWLEKIFIPEKVLERTSPLGRVEKLTYDLQARPTKSEVSGQLPVAFSYRANGELSQILQGTRKTLFSYDSAGFLSQITNSLNQVTAFKSNLVGQTTQITSPDLSLQKFSYDLNGNMVSLTTAAGKVHGLTYNLLNQIASYQAPSLDGTAFPTQTFVYNKDRELQSWKKSSGQTITFTYNLLTGSLESWGTSTAKYQKIGRNHDPEALTSNDGLRTGFSYNQGWLSREELATSAGAPIAGVVITQNSLLKTDRVAVVNNSGVEKKFFTYDYNADELVKRAGVLTIARTTTTGLISQKTTGVVKEKLTYNTFGEISGQEILVKNVSKFKRNWTRDGLGRVDVVTETAGTTVTTTDYDYDLLSRLQSVKVNSAIRATSTFSSASNRINGKVRSQNFTATYDAQDRLLTWGNKTYAYNLDGELKTIHVGGVLAQTLTYDVFSKLKGVNIATGKNITYKMDGAGRRAARFVNGTFQKYFLWTGSRLIAEVNQSGDPSIVYVYGTKEHVPDYMIKSGKTYALISDERGSVRWVIETVTGAIAQQLQYDEWGFITQDTAPGFQSFGFAGGLYDSDTKLVRFGVRDYDPEVGRWISKDPLLFDGGDSNLYGYVLQDPINFIDPEGQFAVPVIAIGVLVGAVLAPTPIGQQITVWGEAARVGIGAAIGAATAMFATGYEFTVAGMRFAPFGNRTNNPFGQLPHYHRRVIDPKTGQTIPGQGIGRHRPWEVKSPDKNFCDRF